VLDNQRCLCQQAVLSTLPQPPSRNFSGLHAQEKRGKQMDMNKARIISEIGSHVYLIINLYQVRARLQSSDSRIPGGKAQGAGLNHTFGAIRRLRLRLSLRLLSDLCIHVYPSICEDRLPLYQVSSVAYFTL
jgi:hypothetical protein